LHEGTHEDTSTALGSGAFTTETLDLPIGIHLIVFQDGHLDLLALVLNLLGGLCTVYGIRYLCREGSHGTHVVSLLLALLSTSTETEDQVKGRLLLDVVVTERAAILELLASEDQALLVGGDSIPR
jgi:hypothetical protein